MANRELGFSWPPAANAPGAPDRLAGRAIAVVLTDLRMDGMDGPRRVRATRPAGATRGCP
ncbi:hypothetical protein OJF2_39930 [Aquisphaera giovannonii]|uniref:Uncharacterized protein n=1 Tax=Aquisphaera giovannonii TaxID=406548 RepID=A0A5B9W644_9BACT|nr:hypothetical protein [Aquisphaera giovannonii]QEH35441.1 hypothetical protein OJF2_39930 [Aquisphaera giovannonii]